MCTTYSLVVIILYIETKIFQVINNRTKIITQKKDEVFLDLREPRRGEGFSKFQPSPSIGRATAAESSAFSLAKVYSAARRRLKFERPLARTTAALAENCCGAAGSEAGATF